MQLQKFKNSQLEIETYRIEKKNVSFIFVFKTEKNIF